MSNPVQLQHQGEEGAAAPTPTVEAPRRSSLWTFLVRAGLGLGVLGFLLAHVDRVSLVASITHENPSFFVLALAIYLLGQALCAFRWQILAQMVELRGTINEFLTYYFIGIF